MVWDTIFIQGREGRWHLRKDLKEVKGKILDLDSCKGREVFSMNQSFPEGSSGIRNTGKYRISTVLGNPQYYLQIIFVFPYMENVSISMTLMLVRKH